MQFTGKVAVVTGANRGIGLELVRQLAAKGNTVYATARKPSLARELKQLAESADVHITTLDVASEESVKQWAQDLASRIRHVDLLINNAGILEPTGLLNVTAEEMMRLFRVNTIGPLIVTQQLLTQGLLGQPGKSVVANMSSKMGSVDDNTNGGYYSYRASKSALNIVTKSLANDLGSHSIKCVILHPGYVKTDMTGGLGRIDTNTCAAGLLAVIESDKPSGSWWDYKGDEISW